ncbi:MAG: hypothetical protein MK212_15830 [Saprospiraceae bacterium]|nr:hypothetical protein [Saprospiraceae bacterium]
MHFQIFINYIKQAIDAFEEGDISTMLYDQQRAFGIFHMYELRKLNHRLYNVLYDATEVLAFSLSILTTITHNDYTQQCITLLQNELRFFVEDSKGGNYLQLDEAILRYANLTKSLCIANDFLKAVEINIEDPLSPISLSVGAESIELYKNIHPKLGKAIDCNQYLRQFQLFFHPKHQNLADFLTEIDQLAATKEYTNCIDLLQDRLKQDSKHQKALFYKLGDILFAQREYAEALEAYMKGYVLGGNKEQIKDNIQKACSHLMLYTDDPKERSHWQKLKQRFK